MIISSRSSSVKSVVEWKGNGVVESLLFAFCVKLAQAL